MSSDEIIRVFQVSKKYDIYGVPKDRLKQAIRSRISKYTGLPHRQYFTEFNALKEVSFSIKRGERLGIIGKNGSGKSTLLQILCGTLTPTSGTVEIKGRVAALLELGSGFNPEFSGRENVFINAAVLGLSNELIHQRIDSIIEFAGIGDFIDQPVKTYSSGMFVRLAFAVIAHVDADILVIDEALAVGDAIFNQKCMRFMDEFSKRGTIILVTHDTSAVTGFCSRAIWLDKGQLLEDGETKAICEAYLAKIYGDENIIVSGDSPKTSGKALELPGTQLHPRDARLDFINATNLRNDIELFRFNPNSTKFGNEVAQIISVELTDGHSHPLSWTIGGEIVCIKVSGISIRTMTQPIIGFVIKDKFGQTLFGDNTYVSTIDLPFETKPGKPFTATFEFRMPIMPTGDYVISAAIAEGTQESHQICQWIHDAIAFRAHSSSVASGLLGIPMQKIQIDH